MHTTSVRGAIRALLTRIVGSVEVKPVMVMTSWIPLGNGGGVVGSYTERRGTLLAQLEIADVLQYLTVNAAGNVICTIETVEYLCTPVENLNVNIKNATRAGHQDILLEAWSYLYGGEKHGNVQGEAGS